MSKKTKQGRPPILEYTCRECKRRIVFKDLDEKSEFYRNKEQCPFCKAMYIMKPETERVLFYLQDEYFDILKNHTRTELEESKEEYEILEQIYLIVKDYAFSLLCSTYKSRLHSQDDITYYAEKSASYLIESYLRPLRCKNKEEGKNECGHEWYPEKLVEDYTKLKCPECGETFIGENSQGNMNKGRTHYEVWGSFKGALLSKGTGIIPYAMSGKDEQSVFSKTKPNVTKYKIQKESELSIYNHKDNNNYKHTKIDGDVCTVNGEKFVWVKQKASSPDIESLNFELQDGNEVEYADVKNNLLKEIEDREDIIKTTKYLTRLILDMRDYCTSPEENIMRLLGIYYRLKRGEHSADNLYKEYGRFGKEPYEVTMFVMQKELEKSRECFYERKD